MMKKCDVCGNEYDKPIEILANGISHYFDCFECAIHALAPECEHCGLQDNRPRCGIRWQLLLLRPLRT